MQEVGNLQERMPDHRKRPNDRVYDALQYLFDGGEHLDERIHYPVDQSRNRRGDLRQDGRYPLYDGEPHLLNIATELSRDGPHRGTKPPQGAGRRSRSAPAKQSLHCRRDGSHRPDEQPCVVYEIAKELRHRLRYGGKLHQEVGQPRYGQTTQDEGGRSRARDCGNHSDSGTS